MLTFPSVGSFYIIHMENAKKFSADTKHLLPVLRYFREKNRDVSHMPDLGPDDAWLDPDHVVMFKPGKDISEEIQEEARKHGMFIAKAGIDPQFDCRSLYSLDLLRNVFDASAELVKLQDKDIKEATVEISMSNDYPMQFKIPDVGTFFIAPRIEPD